MNGRQTDNVYIGPPCVGEPWQEPDDLEIEYRVDREPKRVTKVLSLKASRGALITLEIVVFTLVLLCVKGVADLHVVKELVQLINSVVGK